MATSTRRPKRSQFEVTANFDQDSNPTGDHHEGGRALQQHAPLSVAEPYQDNSGSAQDTSSLFTSRISRLPRLFRYDDAPPEASALAMDIFSRATILMSSIFLGPALLELATAAVEKDCAKSHREIDLNACQENSRIYGFKPSSLLSNIAIVSGVLGSLLMPLFGAIVDHTSHRWAVGAFSALGLVIVKGTETMISSQTWFFVACLQVVSSVLFNVHITTTLAYTSELSSDPVQQTGYNTYYVVVLYISTLLFLAFVTVLSSIFQLGDVGTARISQVTTSSVSAIVFYFAWAFFFRDRPALNNAPPGEALVLVGFRKVFRTFQGIVCELPGLKWFIIAVMFGESATSALVTIGTTYMKVVLEMNGKEFGIVYLSLLAMGAPGSKLGGWVSNMTNPVKSAMLGNSLFIVTTSIAALLLTGPDHKKYMPIIAACWGLGLGWLLPINQAAFITIIPRGQEAELMGLYVLAGQIISWMPPLLFTVLIESGISESYGLASIDLFFFAAIICLLMMGEYERHLEAGHAIQLEPNGLQQTDPNYETQWEEQECSQEMKTMAADSQAKMLNTLDYSGGKTLPTMA